MLNDIANSIWPPYYNTAGSLLLTEHSDRNSPALKRWCRGACVVKGLQVRRETWSRKSSLSIASPDCLHLNEWKSKYLCAQPWKRSREVTFLIWVIDQYWSECRVIILWHSLCSLTTTWDFSSCCYSNLTVIWEHKEVLMTPALRFHVDWPLKVYFETGSEQVKKKNLSWALSNLYLQTQI